MSELRSERGQSLVEGALLSVILMALVLALIDFAFILYAYIGTVSAANAGASFAASSTAAANNLAGITAAALAETDTWNCIGGQPSVSRAVTTDAYGFSMVSVTVSCRVSNLIAIPGSFNAVTVSNTATRRVRP